MKYISTRLKAGIIITIVVIPLVLICQQSNAQNDCSKKLEIVKNKFDNYLTIYTPLAKDVIMSKIITDTSTMFFLSLNVNGSTINLGKKGADIIFSDGSKFSKEDVELETDVDKYNPGYRYRAFILLTEDEAGIFSKKIITDIKLYIHTLEFKSKEAEKFRCAVESILIAKG